MRTTLLRQLSGSRRARHGSNPPGDLAAHGASSPETSGLAPAVRARSATARRDALLGALGGACVPLASVLYLAASGRWPRAAGAWESLRLAHDAFPLLPVVEAAPLWLGALAWIAARRRARVERLHAVIRRLGERRERTIRRLRAVEAAQRHSTDQYRVLFERSPMPMWVFDPASGRILAVNDAAVARYGWSRDEFLALDVFALRDEREHDALRAALRAAQRAALDPHTAGERTYFTVRHRTRDGRELDVEVHGQSMRYDGRPARLVVAYDVTEARRADAARMASEARFRAIFDHAAIGIALHGRDGRFLEANASFQQLVGYTLDELRAMRAADLSPAEEAEITRRPVGELLARESGRVTVEKHLVHRDGTARLCELTITRAASLGDDAVVGMVQDVTERRALERELAWRARHDVLTGLANRAVFAERVAAALRHQRRRADAVAVLFVDLDDFKTVNDTLGHAAGDELLREVAARLLDATRGSDTVARLGGDEFAVLLQNVRGEPCMRTVSDRILAALARPVVLAAGEVTVAASIGIARGVDGDDGDTLLRNADVAMYAAKRRGKRCAELYAPAMHDALLERLALETELRRALDTTGELHCVYQPIFALADARVVGVECLVRWDHPTRGSLPPSTFIPIAEQSGLVVPLGRWVLEQACRQGAAWLAAMPPRADGDRPAFSLTVNVSMRQLNDAALVDDVAEVIAATGMDPRCLVLEITESVIMSDVGTMLDRLHALKALGVRLAIDDFGTGYSSLGYLRQLPVDILKVDKTFVDGVARGGQDAALVRAIVALAESLGLHCVAEGIEHAEQRAALLTLGCAHGQGYLFARPMPAEQMAALLHASLPASLHAPALAGAA